MHVIDYMAFRKTGQFLPSANSMLYLTNDHIRVPGVVTKYNRISKGLGADLSPIGAEHGGLNCGEVWNDL